MKRSKLFIKSVKTNLKRLSCRSSFRRDEEMGIKRRVSQNVLKLWLRLLLFSLENNKLRCHLERRI